VPCWRWDGSAYYAVLKHTPPKCTLGGRHGYQQVDLVKMRWRSWGGGSAYGRGVSLANMGARARVRVKLYRPVSWEENTDRSPERGSTSAGRDGGDHSRSGSTDHELEQGHGDRCVIRPLDESGAGSPC
jgi:hypothetical protein